MRILFFASWVIPIYLFIVTEHVPFALVSAFNLMIHANVEILRAQKKRGRARNASEEIR